MAPPSDRGALLSYWRGLDAAGEGEGWRSIALGSAGGLDVRLARFFPDGSEAFLVGFPGAFVPSDQSLPQAKGFRSIRLKAFDATWFVAVRKDDASLELFASMAFDVIAIPGEVTGSPAAHLKQVIARVTAWQRFMERGDDGLLGHEEEIGLFGELAVLRSLFVGEADRHAVLEAWCGPLGGLQDFRFERGALEVKTAIVGERAHARISGLEQLDTSIAAPFFLVAVRLNKVETGMTLGDLADAAAADCIDDASAAALLSDRLLAAGLPSGDHLRYTRRFDVDSIRVHTVGETFPSLTRAKVPPAIIAARYTIDLDQIAADPLTVAQARDYLRTT